MPAPADQSTVTLPAWIFGIATPMEIAVLGGIQSEWPNTTPSLQRIAERSGVCRRSAISTLDAMEAKGWIRRILRTAKDGTCLPSHYELPILNTGQRMAHAAH